MATPNLKEGWYPPTSGRKWHYMLEDARSICGKCCVLGMNSSYLEQGYDDSSDNCTACRKKLLKRKEEK